MITTMFPPSSRYLMAAVIFGPMLPGGNCSFFQVPAALADRKAVEWPLRRFPEIEVNAIYIRGNSEDIRIELACEDCRRMVLVNHSLHSFGDVVVVEHGHASASARDDHKPSIHAGFNRIELDDSDRLRRRDHSAETVHGILDNHPAEQIAIALGNFFGVGRADRFRRVPEGGIPRIDEDLCDQRDHR